MKKSEVSCVGIGCCVVCVLGIAAVAVLLWHVRSAFRSERRDVLIEHPTFDREVFAEGDFLCDVLIPPAATDIKLHLCYSRGGFMGGPKDHFGGLGAYADLRCRVTHTNLLAFAAARGFAFRADSYTKNDCLMNGCPNECDWISSVWGKYNPSGKMSPQFYRDSSRPEGELCVSERKLGPQWVEYGEPYSIPLPYPKKFLAYNFIYDNCGGHSFFYDVERETLYAQWSSN